MECKYITWKPDNTLEVAELIDTLWNVNPSISIIFSNLLWELIDTLWNVNAFNSSCK